MKGTTRIYDKWQGYTLADCDCRYCLYYGGEKKGTDCLSEECVCAREIQEAIARERESDGSKD